MVEFTSMLIDDGEGPKACIGGGEDSYPPQCGGPRVDGIVLDPSWTESASGVTWGERTIIVSWPPVNGVVSLVEDRVADPADWADSTELERLLDCGDPASAADGESEPCPDADRFGPDELEQAQSALMPLLDASGAFILAFSSGGARNRIEVSLAVADTSAIARIADAVDDPAILRIFSSGVILEGR